MTTFNLETARNMTNDQLADALKGGLEMSAEGALKACIAITVLEEREVPLPMLPEGFRYARDIAEGRLSAHAAMILGSKADLIKAVMPLPLKEQDAIADGKKIKVAVKLDGRVMNKDMSIFQMSQMQLRLVFSDEGITPASEQGEWLHKTGYKEPVPKATKCKLAVDSKTSEILIGRNRVTVDDLIPQLAALGYSVKPIYGTKGIKPAKVV